MNKKMNFLTVMMVIAIDILFYKQAPGINLTIFCALLLSFCIYQKPGLLQEKSWLWVATASMLSSMYAGIFGDVLSVLSCLIAFSLLAAHTAGIKSSIVTALAGAALSYLRSPFVMLKLMRLQILKWQSKRKNQGFIKVGIAILCLAVVLIFFFIYRNSNLLFYKLTQNIKLEFISFFLICFTINAMLIMIAFQKFSPFKKMREILDRPTKTIEFSLINTPEEKQKISLEQFAGVLLFSALNALLLTVNILDINYLFSNELPLGITYSDYIHQGVELLILSIILAISIILYFFRKELNFVKKSTLKLLAYTWIIQNIFMIISNASRNSMYIDAYGLTEKRIGVYFYLLLAAIGLITTLIKIHQKQSNAYLLRSTSIIYFIVLLISSPIKWDNIITRHNLARNDADKNIEYLAGLSFTNLPLMLDYIKKKETTNDTLNLKSKVDRQVLSFINFKKEYDGWQSYSLTQGMVYNDIISRKIRAIHLEHAYHWHLDAASKLVYLNELVIRNSRLDNYENWKILKQLNFLTLKNCHISDLTFLYHLNQLQYLDISENNIRNFVPLYSLKYLKELHVTGIDPICLKKLKLMLPNTVIIISK